MTQGAATFAEGDKLTAGTDSRPPLIIQRNNHVQTT